MRNLALKLAVVSLVGSELATQGDPGSRHSVLDVDPIVTRAPEIAEPSLRTTVRAATRERPKPAAVEVESTPSVAGLAPTSPVPLPDAVNPPVFPSSPETSQDRAASALAVEVLRLSAQADGLDRLWQVYKSDCGVRVGSRHDFGREWFALWDDAAEATIASPLCSEVGWRLLQEGEDVRRGVLRVRAAAQRASLDPGTEVGMLRWHALDW